MANTEIAFILSATDTASPAIAKTATELRSLTTATQAYGTATPQAQRATAQLLDTLKASQAATTAAAGGFKDLDAAARGAAKGGNQDLLRDIPIVGGALARLGPIILGLLGGPVTAAIAMGAVIIGTLKNIGNAADETLKKNTAMADGIEAATRQSFLEIERIRAEGAGQRDRAIELSAQKELATIEAAKEKRIAAARAELDQLDLFGRKRTELSKAALDEIAAAEREAGLKTLEINEQKNAKLVEISRGRLEDATKIFADMQAAENKATVAALEAEGKKTEALEAGLQHRRTVAEQAHQAEIERIRMKYSDAAEQDRLITASYRTMQAELSSIATEGSEGRKKIAQDEAAAAKKLQDEQAAAARAAAEAAKKAAEEAAQAAARQTTLIVTGLRDMHTAVAAAQAAIATAAGQPLKALEINLADQKRAIVAASQDRLAVIEQEVTGARDKYLSLVSEYRTVQAQLTALEVKGAEERKRIIAAAVAAAGSSLKELATIFPGAGFGQAGQALETGQFVQKAEAEVKAWEQIKIAIEAGSEAYQQFGITQDTATKAMEGWTAAAQSAIATGWSPLGEAANKAREAVAKAAQDMAQLQEAFSNPKESAPGQKLGWFLPGEKSGWNSVGGSSSGSSPTFTVPWGPQTGGKRTQPSAATTVNNNNQTISIQQSGAVIQQNRDWATLVEQLGQALDQRARRQ